MEILIRNTSAEPIYEQIVNQIKAQMTTGVLKAGEALPSIRVLAQELSISVITTKRAYEELERDGFIETVPGKGSYIAELKRERLKEIAIGRMEEHLAQAVIIAESAGITKEEAIESLQALFKEE